MTNVPSAPTSGITHDGGYARSTRRTSRPPECPWSPARLPPNRIRARAAARAASSSLSRRLRLFHRPRGMTAFPAKFLYQLCDDLLSAHRVARRNQRLNLRGLRMAKLRRPRAAARSSRRSGHSALCRAGTAALRMFSLATLPPLMLAHMLSSAGSPRQRCRFPCRPRP